MQHGAASCVDKSIAESAIGMAHTVARDIVGMQLINSNVLIINMDISLRIHTQYGDSI